VIKCVKHVKVLKITVQNVKIIIIFKELILMKYFKIFVLINVKPAINQ
jgi:hypothetical protein